ncbi:glycosyltransferase family 1 protein [Leptothoe sp. LEGE 181152]|nr:glycosyltransferase family 1 protein [Leptothoe sp. LEGE 181152]
MKIGFDVRNLTSSVMRGMDRYTISLIKELSNVGHDITLFYRKSEPINPKNINGINCKVVGLSDCGGFSWEQLVIPIALLKGKFDIYHAPAERGVPILSPCPVIFTIHSVTAHSYYALTHRKLLPGKAKDYLGYDFDPNKINFENALLYLQVKKAAFILTPSSFSRGEIIEFLNANPKKVIATHLAVDEEFLSDRKQDKSKDLIIGGKKIEKPYLLYVGGYEDHKNVIGLIKAFSKVKEHRENLKLVTVGTYGIPNFLIKEAEKLHLRLERDIYFLSDLKDELPLLYEQAEILTTLSWRETFCLPALESISKGTPVIGSTLGAVAEVIGEAGITVDPEDHEQFVHAVVHFLEKVDRDNTKDICIKQSKKFCWKKTAEKTFSMYLKASGQQLSPK